MHFTFSLRNIIFASIALVVVMFVLVFFSLFSKTSPNNPPTTPTLSNPSPLQKTQIGVTTEKDIASIPGITKKTLPDGINEYSLESELKTRPDLFLAKDGTIVYEREITPVDPNSPGYQTLSSIVAKFGNPEKEVKGSNYYGSFLNTYIYASQGFTIIANPNTDEVYEIQFYKKTTPEDYLKEFGGDVNPNIKNPSESF